MHCVNTTDTTELRASEALKLVDETGASVLYPGLHFLDVSDGGNFNTSIAIEVPGAVSAGKGLVVKRPPLPPSSSP